MEPQKIVQFLHNFSCVGCPLTAECAAAPNGSVCLMVTAAANALEEQVQKAACMQQEKHACFRLGQMDMQESVVRMLKEFATQLPRGTVRAAVLMAATLVEDMEVP